MMFYELIDLSLVLDNLAGSLHRHNGNDTVIKKSMFTIMTAHTHTHTPK